MSELECSWCNSPATCTVHAQWTVFDWDDEYACGEHVWIARRRFENRLVDGQRVVDVWVTYWNVGLVHVPAVDSP